MLTPERDYDAIAKDAIFDALALILGLNETQANKMIRFSWPSETGSERFTATPTTNVCYIRFTATQLSSEGYVNDNVSSYIDKDGAVVGVERMDTHRGVRAQFIFYGPKSMDNALRIRVGMNRADANVILRDADMSYVPNRQMPVSMDELIDGNWFSRADVSLDFYQLIVYTDTVPLIGSVPDIHIIPNN